MDVLFQRHKAKYIYVIPEGLRELMSDISREVLRTQPENIYNFIADYLDALMITRENARVAARAVELITTIAEQIVELLENAGMSKEKAEHVMEVMQTAFQKYVSDKEVHKFSLSQVPFEERDVTADILEQCDLSEDQATDAAIIIQRAFRTFKERLQKDRDMLLGVVDWRVAARSTLRLYRRLNVTYEEANRAATLIKAAYKGYYTRRVMHRLLEKSKEIEEYNKSKPTYDEGEEEKKDEPEKGEQSLLDESTVTVQEEEVKMELREEEEEESTKDISKSVQQDTSISQSTFETTSETTAPAPSPATTSYEKLSVQTEVIKAPIDELDTDVSGLTDTERSVIEDSEMFEEEQEEM